MLVAGGWGGGQEAGLGQVESSLGVQEDSREADPRTGGRAEKEPRGWGVCRGHGQGRGSATGLGHGAEFTGTGHISAEGAAGSVARVEQEGSGPGLTGTPLPPIVTITVLPLSALGLCPEMTVCGEQGEPPQEAPKGGPHGVLP